jgi:polyisoprenoid-binding protein YceI
MEQLMSTTPVATHARTAWDIDLAHSCIRFSVKHLNISTVHGRFDRWTGSVVLDDAGIERSQVSARIEAASINTHDAARDAHLRSADFFDTDKYPAITFRSTHIEQTLAGGFQMAGDLTITSVTRRVALEVELMGQARDPHGNERAAFSATTTIDRRDFGLVWSQVLEAGGLLVGETVRIEISVEAVRRVGKPGEGARS